MHLKNFEVSVSQLTRLKSLRLVKKNTFFVLSRLLRKFCISHSSILLRVKKKKKCMVIIHIPMEINMDWHVEDDDDDHEDKGTTLNAKYLD